MLRAGAGLVLGLGLLARAAVAQAEDHVLSAEEIYQKLQQSASGSAATVATEPGLLTAQQIRSLVSSLKLAREPLDFDLPQVTFERGSAALTAAARRQLDELALALEQPASGGLGFAIAGHTDAIGSTASNQKLSERRAEAARAYLVERHGYDLGRIAALGLGASRPRPDLPPDAAGQRRIQIQLPADTHVQPPQDR